MTGFGRSFVAGILILSLLAAVAPAPGAANPVVPYCAGSVAPVPPLVPPQIRPDVCQTATSRVFPEAMARPEYALAGNTGYVSDFVAFPEFEAGIKYLETQYPEMVTIHKVADSVGLARTPGGARDRFPIYIVEVTNEASPFPMEERLELLFMLSIHGNEKGGREGGMRVIEDLITGKGIAAETVQNGAGLPAPIAKPSGGTVETYGDYLDFMRAYFLFPNVDGWMHDELPYVASPLCGTLFCRGNGNGTDLNRQTPTIGWQLVNPGAGRTAVNEPEARGWLDFVTSGNHTWSYAIDIHGMLNHENFIAIMMPAGSFSPQEMQRSTRLAESLKERLNVDQHYAGWTTALGTAQTAWAAAIGAANASPSCSILNICPGNGSPTTAVGSGEFSDWSTVWDAIGYTDSGFSGDFFAQSTGMNAPGYDIEMAYNHITVDSQYEAGALFNDFHVHTVRHIVKSFLDAAALDVQISYETGGTKTLFLATSYVATNLDDTNEAGNAQVTPGGWADENPADDYWQYSQANPIQATPAKYWNDMVPFVKHGDVPGVLQGTTAAFLSAELLNQYDTLVIPGSAINQFVAGDLKANALTVGTTDAAKITLVLDWVKAGGNLVLTDAGLNFLDLAGLTTGAVSMELRYAGAIDLNRAHELSANVRGEARQTYEPVPLGFAVGTNSPVWMVDRAAFEGIQGDVAGTGYNDNSGVSLGRVQVGEGQIQLIGALLPDPTEEFYHPYGLDDYATTYSGNQILRNMLGWSEVFEAPPVILSTNGTLEQSPNEPVAASQNPAGAPDEETAADAKGRTPGASAWILVAVIGSLFLVMRRRRSE